MLDMGSTTFVSRGGSIDISGPANVHEFAYTERRVLSDVRAHNVSIKTPASDHATITPAVITSS